MRFAGLLGPASTRLINKVIGGPQSFRNQLNLPEAAFNGGGMGQINPWTTMLPNMFFRGFPRPRRGDNWPRNWHYHPHPSHMLPNQNQMIDPMLLLEMLGLYPHPHPRRVRHPNPGGLWYPPNGGNHCPTDVVIHHHHHVDPRDGRRRMGYPGFRPYIYEDPFHDEESSDSEDDVRSYVRRRPRRYRRRTWSPDYRDLDPFGIWVVGPVRGRPRHRVPYRLRRDGSYTDSEFTLR